MCYKAVDKYTLGLEFVPDCYRTHGICVKAVNAYPSTIQFVPEYYKTQEMFDKAVILFFLYFILLSSELGLTKGVTELLLSILLC